MSVIPRTSGLWALVGASLVAFWPSTVAIAGLWSDFDSLSYAHGWLLAAASVWLLWHNRRDLAAAAPGGRPSSVGFLLLLGAVLAWLVFWRASIRDLHILMLPLLAWLCVFAAFGSSVAARVAFPMGYVYFALPIWDVLIPVLQTATIYAVRLLVRLVGLPAQFDGIRVHIPEGTLEIEGGCSGLHFFVVGTAIAALLGEINRDPLRTRLKLVAQMAALALLANWVRVFALVVISHVTHMRHYFVYHHYYFGWAIFGVALFVFLFMPRRARPETGVGRAAGSRADATFHGAVTGICGVLLVISAAPIIVHAAAVRGRDSAASAGPVTFPVLAGEWSGPGLDTDGQWRPVFRGASSQIHVSYRNRTGQAVEAFAVSYRTQKQGAELVSSANSVLGHEGLQPLGARVASSPAGRMNELLVADVHGKRSLVWYGYDIAGHRTVSPVLAQVWYGAVTLVGEKSSQLTAFRAPCSGSCDEARTMLKQLTQAVSGSSNRELVADGGGLDDAQMQ